MLGLLTRLVPGWVMIAVAALAAVPASYVGWVTRGFVFEWIEKPALVHQQQELCTAEVEKAAAEARAAEQLRQFRAAELATEQFIRQSESAADDRQAEMDVLQLEVERYAQLLSDRGRVCPLDRDDLTFLGVQPVEPGPPGGGR